MTSERQRAGVSDGALMSARPRESADEQVIRQPSGSLSTPVSADGTLAQFASARLEVELGHPTALARRQAAVLRLQKIGGNTAVQRALARLDRVAVPGPVLAPAAGVRIMLLPPAIQREPAGATPTVRQPEDFPTYEGWLAAFIPLINDPTQTFRSRDTAAGGVHAANDKVLGQQATTRADAPPPIGEQAADHFIDHPTDDWVKRNLPERLRVTAYQLPTDCADLAVVLRHVWLAYHKRSETFGRWTIGYSASGENAERDRLKQVIGEVYSGNVASMVSPYSEESGKPIRRFEVLKHMLHPGDVLVWEHHDPRDSRNQKLKPPAPIFRTGGHTQTIANVKRDDSGDVTEITLLQGNQPIFQEQAEEIKKQEKDAKRSVPSAGELRDAPGRRIEIGTLAGTAANPGDLQDLPVPHLPSDKRPEESVWTWDDSHTRLVAAGPPMAARRPPAHHEAGAKAAVRRISDWFGALASATRATLPGRFEAALLEARALIEGGQGTVSDDDARTLGRTAGESLWRLAKAAHDRGDESHFRALTAMRATVAALSQAGLTPRVGATFKLIDPELNAAARGATTIQFERKGATGRRKINVLLTGFDPFSTSSRGAAPRSGEWNPSGAAVLALAGSTITAGKGIVAAVEGIVLPVSFDDFGGGIVERSIGSHAAEADAVITVSMDPSIDPNSPVRIERYAVGVHQLDNGTFKPISGTGPAIIEAPAAVNDIAAATAQPAGKGAEAIQTPDIGTNITFELTTSADADAARAALGQPARQPPATDADRQVTIGDPAVLSQVIPTLQRIASPAGLRVTFGLGGRQFEADILDGPGGNYLSNEVSYRVLELLQEQHGAKSPISFHVHTQRGGDTESLVPPDVSTPQAAAAHQQAARSADHVRSTLIATLRRMITVVATGAAKNQPSLQRSPTVGWTGARPGSANAGERAVQTPSGAVRRIPLRGLPNNGQAIAVIPPAATDPTAPPKSLDVLLYFHGHNAGYKGQDLDQVRDVAVEQIEAQVAASGRAMIGVLPQGTGSSEFGGPKGSLGFDSNSFLNAVFAQLGDLAIWTVKMPGRGQVILSGHSGGGLPVSEMLKPAGQDRLPTGLGEVALFDAINGPKELAAVKGWVTQQLDADYFELLRLERAFPWEVGKAVEAQRAFLATSMRFRAYYEPKPLYDYKARHVDLQSSLQDLFAARAIGISSSVWDRWTDNYRVIEVADAKDHDSLVGTGALRNAIDNLPPAPTTSAAASSGPASPVPP
jgi:hypothetical protein